MEDVDGTIKRYLDLYDDALPEVYGYVRRRVDSDPVAEDVTAEVFLSALHTIKRGVVVEPSVAWMIGVARHKVADHWRRQARHLRRVEAAAEEASTDAALRSDHDGGWDRVLDADLAHTTLSRLSTDHRAVLSLRYLDGLPVGEIASLMDRTVGATESLLTRAKVAFRHAYPESAGPERRSL